MSEKKYPIGEVRVYFVFKHPKTGEEMSSKLYTPLELLDTDLSIINERTCVCDCKPVGETNVVECNCDDYYQDFQFHSYQVELAQPGPVWVKASERLPGWRTPVRWRLKGVEMKKYDVAYISQAESPAHWMDLEWLDESATPSESPAEQPVREVEFADLKRKGESLALELRRCIGTMIVHPDYQPNSEFRDRIDSANDALNEWSGEKEREP